MLPTCQPSGRVTSTSACTLAACGYGLQTDTVMNVQVRLFAVARDIAGVDAVDVEVAEPASARDVARALVEQVPALAQVVSHSILAVDGDLAPDEMVVQPSAEVALIPPVSGG
jgi:molybdopterin converting factor small subunit